jgi:hypothetical protein
MLLAASYKVMEHRRSPGRLGRVTVTLIFHTKAVLVIAAASWSLSALAAISYWRQLKWSRKIKEAPVKRTSSRLKG